MSNNRTGRFIQKTLIGSLACLGFNAFAEVKSLTSGELTDTYIKDSTIIVTPAVKAPAKKTTRTYTIAPGEPVKTESEEQADLETSLANEWQEYVDAAEFSKQRTREQELALANITTPDLIPLTERTLPYNMTLPEGAFTFEQVLGQTDTQPITLPYGDELNIQSNGQELTISVGNLPGVDPILLQQSLQGGLVNLKPRDNGGFDLTLTIPQQ
ncbi:hypothetical protein BTA51_10745 [Hahella sp. CCB-MM4]|uniref:hypothetical protein n=1 Tax=Hahella sp. (strain CCB-MM4) TaxID=1926491 RepID=UPI000B9C52DC|nr:hypothetical protein [Hahella sp. CCB-MM4]OZG73486.1 hypothetical protein BTA51_10745 [Hahella sp. CCB-MM4]